MKGQTAVLATSMAALALSGCVYRTGSAKLYRVKSGTEAGRTAILENDIQYKCNNVWDLYGADAHRSECMFIAVRSSEATSRVGDDSKQDVSYVRVPDQTAAALAIQPAFNVWQRWGIGVALILGLCAAGLMILVSMAG